MSENEEPIENGKVETDADNSEDDLNTGGSDTGEEKENNEEEHNEEEANENNNINAENIMNANTSDDNETINTNNLDDQENQSARASKLKSRSNSKMADPKNPDANIDLIETLPDGCVAIFLSTPTLEIFKIKPDETVTPQNPIVYINKTSIIEDISNRAAVSDFSVMKSQIKSYNGEDILFVYDQGFKFSQNFVMATTETAKEEILKLIVIEEAQSTTTKSPDEAEAPGQAMLTGDFIPPLSKHWACLGSDAEVNEKKVVLNRSFVRTLIQRPRREFGLPVNFTSKPATKDYIEIPSYEDNSFSLTSIELDKNESNAPILQSVSTNTTWRYPRNAFTQYEPRQITDDECQSLFNSDKLVQNLKSSLPYIIESVQHNEITNLFLDDYGLLAPGDTVFDQKTDNYLKEFQTFADLNHGKDKAITQIEWHPTIKGIIATSLAEKSSFDQRIDSLSKVILTRSYIIIWSFLDPIQPQVLLEAPADLYCFKFNPTDPNYVAGGCVNGQLVLWDMESLMDDLKNVKAKIKSRNALPLFSFDNSTEPKISQLRYAAVSHCDSSHTFPIVDIDWLPDHYELNHLGHAIENLSQKSVQIVTVAGDNKVNVWDIRQGKAVIGGVDKAAVPIPTPAGVPETFKHLDMKWKPTLRIQLFKIGIGGDYAPTKCSFKEVQGDRRVLDLLDEKDKADDMGVLKGTQKGRTLQAVNTHIYVGTEDGELVYVDWMPQKDSDTGKLQTPKPDYAWTLHDGPISSVVRSPFDRGVLLVVGGWIWSLWKEGINSGPILQSCTSAKPLTGGIWSPTKASVFFIIRADGCVEIWDILDKTHEPSLVQNISSAAALTAVSIYNFVKKQLIAIGDINGSLHVYEIPVRFKQHSQAELNDTLKYLDREVKRRDFVQRRWNFREQEKIEREMEAKRKAGIAPTVTLTDDEIKAKMKVEYDQFLNDEQTFLRELGLKDEE